MVRTKFAQVFNFLKSTDIKSMLVKMIIMVVAVVCSFFSGIGALASFLLFCIFVLIEFSFTSIVWLLILVLFYPFSNLMLCLCAVFLMSFVYVGRFLFCILTRKIKINNWQSISILAVAGMIILFILLPIAPFYDFIQVLANVMLFVLLTIIIINGKEMDFKTIFIVFSSCLLALCIIYNFVTFFDLCYEIVFKEGNLYRFNLCILDPNYTGGALICALASILVLYKNKNINRILFFVLLFGLSLCIFNTISKATFIVYCLLIGFALAFLIVDCFKKKDKKSLIELALFLGTILISILIGIKAFLEILKRFMQVNETVVGEDKLSVVTTGRTEIWVAYIKEIFSSPGLALFGHGSYAPILGFDTHNAILSLLYEFGIVGFLLFFALYLIGFIKHSNKNNYFSWLCSIAVLIMYMSLALSLFIYFYVFVIVFAVFIYGGKEEDKASVNVNNS